MRGHYIFLKEIYSLKTGLYLELFMLQVEEEEKVSSGLSAAIIVLITMACFIVVVLVIAVVLLKCKNKLIKTEKGICSKLL